MKSRLWWGFVAVLCAWNGYDHLAEGGEQLRGALEAGLALVLAVGVARDALGARSAERATADFAAFLHTHDTNTGTSLARRDADGSWHEDAGHNADQKFPLASTRKVLILCALSELIHDGSLAPEEPLPLREVRRFHLPGTDGGAFARAYSGSRRGTEITLRDCAQAMIHHSCNASAEYLWQRVGGRPALTALADRYGMRRQDPVHSGYGEFLASSLPYVLGTLRRPADQLADRYDRLGARPHRLHALLLRLPTAGLRDRALRRGCAGTPREWARLFQTLIDTPPDDSPLAFARKTLGWPMRENPANAKVYHDVLAKGGSLPGTVSQVYAVHSRTAPGPAVMACFLKDLTAAQWKILSTTPRQDRYMVTAMSRRGDRP